MVENVPQAKPFAPQIMDAAKESYVAGFHTASLVAAAVLLVGMVVVIKFLPARHREEAPAGAGEVAGVGVTAADPVPGAPTLATVDGAGQVAVGGRDGVGTNGSGGVESLEPEEVPSRELRR